jgi:hypothetical protein
LLRLFGVGDRRMTGYWASGEWYWKGKNRNFWRKTCHSTTLSTTNPKWTGLGLTPGLRGDSPNTFYILNISRPALKLQYGLRTRSACEICEFIAYGENLLHVSATFCGYFQYCLQTVGWGFDTQHNTTQHNTTQHNTTQHNTTQHNTTQYNTTQHNTIFSFCSDKRVNIRCNNDSHCYSVISNGHVMAQPVMGELHGAVLHATG